MRAPEMARHAAHIAARGKRPHGGNMELSLEGKAYINGEFVKCCIGIERGRIKRIGKTMSGSDEHLDFGENLILPAAIDIHTHMRDPGFPDKEDFASGTMAAAFGGVSCVFDMPNTKPPTTTVEALKDKIEIARKKAYVDFGIYAGAADTSEIAELGKLCTAFKIYTATTTGDMAVKDDKVLKEILLAIKETSKVASIHAEDESVVKESGGAKSLLEYSLARGAQCETGAIKSLLLTGITGGIHIAHVSTVETLELLKITNFTTEVTPHHLFLNSSMDLGTLGKVNPPLRRREDQTALWNAMNAGEIDVIASDHAPHTQKEKEKNFSDAPSGMPGVETMMPLMLWAYQRGSIFIDRLVKTTSERPSELFGLNKGKIAEGMDADLIVVDLSKETRIDADKLHSKCGWSPYNGFAAIFPHTTIVRGEIVVKDGKLVGKKGAGRYVSEQETKRKKGDDE